MSSCARGCFTFAADDPDVRAYGIGAAALRYARLGFAVLPLESGAKRPHPVLVPHGVRQATRDAAAIRDWWSQAPGANIGVACGSASRLAVIDMDCKNELDGKREFGRFLYQHEGYAASVLRAPCASTPSGGWHMWLRVPDGVRVPERPGILPGVDAKGDGGYVVAAPSGLLRQVGDRSGQGGGMAGVPYRWAAGCPCSVPYAPPWLVPWLEQAQPAGTYRQDKQDRQDSGDVPDGTGGLVPGSRNRDMYRYACAQYRRCGTDPEGAAEVLRRCRELWQQSDTAGFGWSEVLTCIASARQFIEKARHTENEQARSFLGWYNGRD